MTIVRPSDEGAQRAVFLDTNALVRLFHFWEACRDATIRLDAVVEWADLKEALKAAGVDADTLTRENAYPIRQGIRPFQNLHRDVSSHQYLSSHVSWAELHHALLAERGMERMILRGVPRSVRVKRPQMLFRAALEQADYAELHNDLTAFRRELRDDYGLDVITVEDQAAGFVADPRDIWEGAQAVWSHVLIETLDAYLYAAAIIGGSDIFVSSDESLRSALHNLWQPTGDWIDLVDSLKQELKEVWRLDHGSNSSVELPRPVRPQDSLPT